MLSHSPLLRTSASLYLENALPQSWAGAKKGAYVDTLPTLPLPKDFTSITPSLPFSIAPFKDNSFLLADKTDKGWLVYPDPLLLSPHTLAENTPVSMVVCETGIATTLSRPPIAFANTLHSSLMSLYADIINAGPIASPGKPSTWRTCAHIKRRPVDAQTIHTLKSILNATATLCARENTPLSYITVQQGKPSTPWHIGTSPSIAARLANTNTLPVLETWLCEALMTSNAIASHTLVCPTESILLTADTLPAYASMHDSMEARQVLMSYDINPQTLLDVLKS